MVSASEDFFLLINITIEVKTLHTWLESMSFGRITYFRQSHPKLIVYHDSSNFASFLYDFYEVFSSETYCLMLKTWSTLSLGYESKYQFYMFIKFIFIV